MPNTNENFARLFDDFKQGFTSFAEKCATAVRSGAVVSGEQIKTEVEQYVQPSVLTEILLSALNSGVNVARQQIIDAGSEFVDSIKTSKTDPKK